MDEETRRFLAAMRRNGARLFWNGKDEALYCVLFQDDERLFSADFMQRAIDGGLIEKHEAEGIYSYELTRLGFYLSDPLALASRSTSSPVPVPPKPS